MNDSELVARILNMRLVVFDFDGVFTDNAVYVAQDGTETVRCWRGDGIGLQTLRTAGVAAVIVSTEPNSVVLARARKLEIECIHGCDDKLAALDTLCRRENLSRAQVAFVGNDVNDRACLEVVGLPIVVRDAHEDVIPLARYRTTRAGGHGAVREVCDLIAHVRSHAR